MCTLIPCDSTMVPSHNPPAVAVVALRGFRMVGSTSGKSKPKVFAAVPALAPRGEGHVPRLQRFAIEGSAGEG